ncbi:MAG TPA: penicillin acylase family protein, partial [Fimbriimonadaceae bacterium]|nr:penicillin acylase family protein [Fimbriimonadaceae bacterium]
GYAVAEDRLWQMEMSRRMARGKAAAVLGRTALESDREVLRYGYTDEELQQQLEKLSPPVRMAYREYTRGVNAFIEAATREDRLPEGYAKNGFEPEQWTEVDSAAITVRLFQLFGRGGAGEVRNLALYLYMQNQAAKAQTLDVLDDFLWFNDPRSPTTVKSEDEQGGNGNGHFSIPSRAETQHHLNNLPKYNLLELLPGLRLEEFRDSDMLAEHLGVPYKMGSYAVVVGKDRSSTGRPLLLGAPQMGFTNPSIIHEISISAPGLKAAGMDVPGVPGVAIGYTDRVAWTLTSGIADTDDVFSFGDEGSAYRYGNEKRPYQTLIRPLKVKGEDDVRVEQKRTHWGPVVVQSGTAKAVLARRSSYWMRELESAECMFGLLTARNASDVEKTADKATMTFNLFYATTEGDVGYRYLGLVPVRAPGVDPRFPAVASPQTDWKGFMPIEHMPRVRNPKHGLIANWNNKPISWWPNADTPAWGRIFRSSTLDQAIPPGPLSAADLEFAAWTIARRNSDALPFLDSLKRSLGQAALAERDADAWSYLRGYDGRALGGSVGETLFNQYLIALREDLFTRHVGALIAPDTFRTAIQPSLILNALEGKTKFNYLAGRQASEVIQSAFQKAVSRMSDRDPDPANWGYRPGAILYEGEAPVPYSNRGTYIQIVELRPTPYGRNVVTPGVAESGPHAKDQIPLARQWSYKPMRIRP